MRDRQRNKRRRRNIIDMRNETRGLGEKFRSIFRVYGGVLWVLGEKNFGGDEGEGVGKREWVTGL
jgi:hypothetical protein